MKRGGRWAAIAAIAAAEAASCSGSTGDSAGGPGGGNPGSGGNNVSTGSGGSSGAGGVSGGTGGAGTGGSSSGDASAGDGSSDVTQGCFLNLIPLSAPSFDDIERGPMPFRVRGQATPAMDGDQWLWDVTLPDGTPMHPTAAGSDPAVIEFPLSMKGVFTIVAHLGNRPICGSASRGLNVIDPRPTAFLFRVFPPAGLALPVQEFRVTREQVPGGLTLNTQVDSIHIFAYDSVAQPLPSYMQVSSPGSNLVIEGNTARGPVTVALLRERQYDILLIPSGQVAPALLSGLPSQLKTRPLSFDPGLAVTGTATRNDGSPVADARLVLRAGARPSTIGISDASGAFALFTRDGSMSVDVSAPRGSGLPDAHVEAAPGVVLAPSATGVSLAMRWAALTAGALSLTVRAADGTTALAGATVTAALSAPIASAGQLIVHPPGGGGDVTLTATGTVRADGTSDSKGLVTFGKMPAGSYQITVVPPPTAGADAAITTTTVDVTAAGVARDVRVGRKVAVTGVLQPAASSAGARVTAIDSSGNVITPNVTADVGSGGRYTLALHPGRMYKLWAAPSAGQPYGRAMVGTVTAPASAQALPDFTLPRGAAVTGSVRAATPVGDALVQVFCPPQSTACPDTSLPIAEAVTAGDGTFNVVLPDPGGN